jgi:hypothetical protein
LIGKPRNEDPRFSSLERMLRIYVGIHDRQKDIDERHTFYAVGVYSVSLARIFVV